MEHQDREPRVLHARPNTAAERCTVAAIRSAMRGGAPVEHARRDRDREERERQRKLDGDAEPDLPILNPAMRQRLVQARCARKLSQQALANAANLRPQVVQDLEGGRPVAQPGVLQKLQKVLGSNLRLRFGRHAAVPSDS